MSEEYTREERDPELKVEDNIILFSDIESHWRVTVEENIEDKVSFCAMRW